MQKSQFDELCGLRQLAVSDIPQIDVTSRAGERYLECKFRCVYTFVYTDHHLVWRLAKE